MHISMPNCILYICIDALAPTRFLFLAFFINAFSRAEFARPSCAEYANH